tara:strand:+ start:597 stop:1025 length:429 start_codon:yes stop_codon:yes gene_type:complete
MYRLILFFIFIASSSFVFAIDSKQAFNDPNLQKRYEKLIAETRCVTCQNQNIKDSNAIVASDLRREIRRMIGEGLSNDQINDFLVTRYGDFVLYRPRYNGKMLLLWIAPFGIFLFGSIVVIRVVRHRARLMENELTKEGNNQ